MTSAWDALELDEPLRRAVEAEGYETPTPIQVDAIPHVLAGRDLMGRAQTGFSKTARRHTSISSTTSRRSASGTGNKSPTKSRRGSVSPR